MKLPKLTWFRISVQGELTDLVGDDEPDLLHPTPTAARNRSPSPQPQASGGMVDLLVGRKVLYETAVKTAQESGQSSKVKTDRFFFAIRISWNMRRSRLAWQCIELREARKWFESWLIKWKSRSNCASRRYETVHGIQTFWNLRQLILTWIACSIIDCHLHCVRLARCSVCCCQLFAKSIPIVFCFCLTAVAMVLLLLPFVS